MKKLNQDELKSRIKQIAKEHNRNFNFVLKTLFLERFLVRLSASTYKDKLIFKGGMLLSKFIPIQRETMDIDLLLDKINANEESLKNVFSELCSIKIEDNFMFEFEKIEPLNQPHMKYPGFRTTLNASFEKIRDKVHIDIGVGDLIIPKDTIIDLLKTTKGPLYENKISLLAYSIETIFAEKYETIISKNEDNSRMRDYHDLLLIIKNQNKIDKTKLKNEINNTFNNRKTKLSLINFNEKAIEKLQFHWKNHQNNLSTIETKADLSEKIVSVIAEINDFLSDLHLKF